MTHDIASIITKYIDLRDRSAALAKKQAEEMEQLSKPMEAIETWLLQQMNAAGCDSLKANGVGTAFKVNKTSMSLKEPEVFKQFVLAPAVHAALQHIAALGINLQPVEQEKIAEIIRDVPRWDIVDFRAGKKGIQEFEEAGGAQVPGIATSTITTVQIRRA
jgi:hypothetical protein